MLVHCEKCGSAVDDPLQSDIDLDRDLSRDREGLIKKLARYIPTAQIPDNNMQRESALHKKGYKYFHQFFSTRQLISLASLRAAIEEEPAALRDVLLLAFSSTLRFGNRMVTRNPAWRGDRPLEWVGTGFWLPTVYLDANLEYEFQRRANAVVKGKLDFNGPASGGESSAAEVASHAPGAVWAVETRSSTKMPLPDSSIDAIVTDPPYGSYVHYADMSNFWNVWLPRDEQRGTGTLIGTTEEAVVARKRFPGAKDSSDYSRLLADVFAECFRVLRPGRCMVLTFNNREPRAWAALIVAACKAGFHVPTGGVVFQPGVSNYRHTARTRRSGSVHGDFIITFRKLPGVDPRSVVRGSEVEDPLTEEACIVRIEQVLGAGPLDTEQLMREFYKSVIPDLIEHIWGLDSTAAEELLLRVDRLDLFNSERQERLRTRLTFDGGLWRARATSGAGKQGKCNS
jgi:hypothetical protein